MEVQNKQPIEMKGYDQSTSGTLFIRTVEKGERIKIAVGRGAIGLFISAILVGIPILHFLLVPIGLIVTAVIVQHALNRTEIISGGEGPCPFCGSSMSFVQRRVKFPFLERCSECSRESTVQPA